MNWTTKHNIIYDTLFMLIKCTHEKTNYLNCKDLQRYFLFAYYKVYTWINKILACAVLIHHKLSTLCKYVFYFCFPVRCRCCWNMVNPNNVRNNNLSTTKKRNDIFCGEMIILFSLPKSHALLCQLATSINFTTTVTRNSSLILILKKLY